MTAFLKRENLPWIVGGILGLWLFGPQLFRAVSREAARTAASIPLKTAEGIVIGVGEAVGIPETDTAKCQAAVDAGDWWNASFYCPAGTFLREVGGAIVDVATGEEIAYSEPTDAPEIIRVYEGTEKFPTTGSVFGGSA